MSAVDESYRRRSSSLDGESYPEEKPKFKRQKRKPKAQLSKIIGVLTESEDEANEPEEDLIYQEISSVPTR